MGVNQDAKNAIREALQPHLGGEQIVGVVQAQTLSPWILGGPLVIMLMKRSVVLVRTDRAIRLIDAGSGAIRKNGLGEHLAVYPLDAPLVESGQVFFHKIVLPDGRKVWINKFNYRADDLALLRGVSPAPA